MNNPPYLNKHFFMQKRFPLLSILMLFYTAIFSQTEKGHIALSGHTDASLLLGKNTVSVDSVRSAGSDLKAFNINLGVAYFLADNFAVGVSGTAYYSGVKEFNSDFFIHKYIFGVIPTLTYFVPVNGKLKPNITSGAGYIWVFKDDLDAKGLSLNVSPGVSFFANQHISVDLGVQYSYNKLKNETFYGDSKPSQQQGIGLLFGFSVYF